MHFALDPCDILRYHLHIWDLVWVRLGFFTYIAGWHGLMIVIAASRHLFNKHVSEKVIPVLLRDFLLLFGICCPKYWPYGYSL
jgi:hypothetical protein